MFEFIAAQSPSAPRRQALLCTIERAASIASIKVRPALAPAQISLKLYSIAWRAALSAASSSSPECWSATFRMTAARSIARWSEWRAMIAPATLPRAGASLMSLEDGPVTRLEGYRIAGLRAVSRLTPFLPLLTGQTSSDTQPPSAAMRLLGREVRRAGASSRNRAPSRAHGTESPLRCGTSTGTTSSVKRPSSHAAAARRWLSAAKASAYCFSIASPSSRAAEPYDRKSSVTNRSGAKAYLFRGLRINFSAACLFRFDWTRTSRTPPSASTARQSFLQDLVAGGLRQQFEPIQIAFASGRSASTSARASGPNGKYRPKAAVRAMGCPPLDVEAAALAASLC